MINTLKNSNFFFIIVVFATINFGLWSLGSSAQYIKLLDFDGVSNGKNPNGSLVSDGTFLYGMTHQGGLIDSGVVFKIKPDGTGYFKLLDFIGIANGKDPYGSLIFDSTFLYGMTRLGGINNLGVVFKIKPDGSGFSKLMDFAGTANGSIPYGDLISDGIFLYGMTAMGGTNNMGTIFKIKPDGTEYANLLNFSGTVNGKWPYGSLIYADTFLYGMTTQGGTNNMGTVFKIKPDGTGFLKLHDFVATNGASPYGSLFSCGTFLYGMTYQGGANSYGTVFKIMPDGTGFVKLYDFDYIPDGMHPFGSFNCDETYLYGMTSYGGANNMGIIFKIKPNGLIYSILHNFSGITDGRGPFGSLIFDGTFFYGMTFYGGTNNLGTVFKYGVATEIAENKTDLNFTITPNPTNGIFLINPTSEINSIEVFNMLGEIIYNSRTNNVQITKEINLNCLSKGIYFVKVDNGKENRIEKMIIQ